jgi:hypothetical protein
MEPEERRESGRETEQATAAQFTGDAEPGEVLAWEEIDTGRYMPRRIKGSCKGRALG